MMNLSKTRRQFLGEASCASIGGITTLSSILNLKLANQAAAAGLTTGTDCKTLVCILLAGGHDSYNFLIPRDTTRYNIYSNSRGGIGNGGMALDRNLLNNLQQTSGGDGNLYGLHPECSELADMFNGTGDFSSFGRRLSIVSNIGTLVEPITTAQYNNPITTKKIPKALFSHIDQINQWQTSIPQGLPELSGWAGRMADLIHSSYNTEATSMSISLAGNNVFQIGQSTSQFAITSSGALLPTAGSNTANRKNAAVDSLLSASYNGTVA